MKKMKTIRVAIMVTALASVLALIPVQAVLAADTSSPDSGTITWERQREYWPNEAQARYWITYPAVEIEDLCPGASNEYRLTIGNVTDEPLTLEISVLTPNQLEQGYGALPDTDWVSVTPEASDEPGEVEPAEELTVAPKSYSHVWVQVKVPDAKKWQDQKWQVAIKVTEVDQKEGPESLLTVSTADHMPGIGEKNAPVILGVFLGVILLIGAAVYGFSRWRWPDEPKEKREKDERKKKGAGTLSPQPTPQLGAVTVARGQK